MARNFENDDWSPLDPNGQVDSQIEFERDYFIPRDIPRDNVLKASERTRLDGNFECTYVPMYLGNFAAANCNKCQTTHRNTNYKAPTQEAV